MNRYLRAKVRISEQNTKEKSIFLLFSSESRLSNIGDGSFCLTAAHQTKRTVPGV